MLIIKKLILKRKKNLKNMIYNINKIKYWIRYKFQIIV